MILFYKNNTHFLKTRRNFFCYIFIYYFYHFFINFYQEEIIPTINLFIYLFIFINFLFFYYFFCKIKIFGKKKLKKYIIK